jgi:hypothetical protein
METIFFRIHLVRNSWDGFMGAVEASPVTNCSQNKITEDALKRSLSAHSGSAMEVDVKLCTGQD